MTVEATTLPNGLRVVSHHMGHVETVSLGVWIGSGAASEESAENGVSHFLEHMAFKGTNTRSARAIAEQVENVGGDINAATSLEATAYYARVLKSDAPMILDILADILQNSVFDTVEIDRERAVILQEIAAANDTPDDIVFDLVQDAAFPDQALGRPILGTNDSVCAVNNANLSAFLAKHYTAGNHIIAAAGAIDHDHLVRHVEAQFGALNGARPEHSSSAQYEGGAKAAKRPFEQTHIVLALHAPSYHDDGYYAAQVLSGLLGGGMSSRLFQEVREKRGLCYSIYAYSWGVADTGLFGIHAATGQEAVAELRDVVIAELLDIADHGPTEQELRRAKAQLKVGLAMSHESSGARTEQMARHTLAFGRTIEAEELTSHVERITLSDIRNVAQSMIANGTPTWAMVGPNCDEDHHGRIRELFQNG